jgi:hypothetical protein
MKLLITQFSPAASSAFLGTNILLGSLFSNIVTLWFSSTVKDKISYPKIRKVKL